MDTFLQPIYDDDTQKIITKVSTRMYLVRLSQ